MNSGSLQKHKDDVKIEQRNVSIAKSIRFFGLLLAVTLPLTVRTQSPKNGAVQEQWKFHFSPDGNLREQRSSAICHVVGNFFPAVSPVGEAVKLDGYTGSIVCPPLDFLNKTQDLAVSAWVQLEAYPWNRVPIIDQLTDSGSFYFGIDQLGHLVTRVGSRTGIRSTGAIPLRQWTLVTLSFHGATASFTINAASAGAVSFENDSAESAHSPNDLRIGHTRFPLLPEPSNMIHPTLPVAYSIEGSIGDITVFRSPLDSTQINSLFGVARKDWLGPTPWPRLPGWQNDAGTFGAYYTSLAFDPIWDNTRRVGPDSDVVVRFDDSPVQLVFWQGTNYVPAWVTENNRWYTDEFMEIFGHPRCPYGEDCEPMSDKQARYSHVRILESTPARAVVDWRYALSEVQNYAIGDAGTPIAWGDWADEYWTIYPDHVAVRRSVLWSTAPERPKTEFQESIVIVPPGQTPEDNVNLDALTFANLQGETATYEWKAKTMPGLSLPKGPKSFPEPKNLVIQRVNLKSEWKPFEIVWGDQISTDVYNGEDSMSSFEWWNHWPVGQIPSSGRPALAADRPGHTSLSHLYWPAYQETDTTLTKILLTGLTQLPASKLVPLAKSWRNPPELTLKDGRPIPYDPAQRAYLVPKEPPGSKISLILHATQDRPAEHLVLVLPGRRQSPKVSVDGEPASSLRVGIVDSLQGPQAVLYFPLVATHEIRINLSEQ